MPNSPTTADPPAIEGLDVKVVFIYYFACVTAITCLSLSQICHWSLLSPLPYRWGLTVGAIAAYWNHTQVLAVAPLQLSRLEAWLKDKGYQITAIEENLTIYCSPQGWRRGAVTIRQLQQNLAEDRL